MNLYFSPNACSLAPHIVLRELALPFNLVRVDNRNKTTADGADFLAINPKGYVAALELEDGQVLTEGPAILQYLADLKPQAGLAPANGSWQRVRLQEMLNFVSSEIHGSLGWLFNPEFPEATQALIRQNCSSAWRCWTARCSSTATCWAKPSASPTPTCSPCCAGPPALPSTWNSGRRWPASRHASPSAKRCKRRWRPKRRKDRSRDAAATSALSRSQQSR